MIHQNLDNKTTTFVSICDCHSEVIVLEYDHEWEMADIAIYEHGISYKNKMSLFQKFRYIYQVLVNNKPYADQTMLSKTQLMELKDFLNSIT